MQPQGFLKRRHPGRGGAQPLHRLFQVDTAAGIQRNVSAQLAAGLHLRDQLRECGARLRAVQSRFAQQRERRRHIVERDPCGLGQRHRVLHRVIDFVDSFEGVLRLQFRHRVREAGDLLVGVDALLAEVLKDRREQPRRWLELRLRVSQRCGGADRQLGRDVDRSHRLRVVEHV